MSKIMIFYKRFLISILFVLCSVFILHSQKVQRPLTRILFIFDGSQSMMGKWQSGKKINIARNLLINMVDSLQQVDNIQLALRVYGHQYIVPPQRCDDTKLEVPFGYKNGATIKKQLYKIYPKGTTPIARSLELAANDFPVCKDCRNIIILITDGIEACDGDPCAVSLALQEKGIMLKPFVIGIGLDLEFKKTFECVGQYYDASDEKRFKEVLGVVISQALNNTTCQVNLLDISGLPTETNVNMTFIDTHSGKIKQNYMHTINHRGNPDTIILDPFITYKMIVHTIPSVEVDSFRLVPGKHKIIACDAPQGTLLLKTKGSQYQNLSFILRKKDSMQTLNVQKINRKEKYIVGKYDIEVLTLPRIYVKDVAISQSYATTIEIPQPGMATFLLGAVGYGSIYIEKNNELEWIYNIKEDVSSETISLQPGRYKVVYRAKNAKKTLYTIEKLFKISSGRSTAIRLN